MVARVFFYLYGGRLFIVSARTNKRHHHHRAVALVTCRGPLTTIKAVQFLYGLHFCNSRREQTVEHFDLTILRDMDMPPTVDASHGAHAVALSYSRVDARSCVGLGSAFVSGCTDFTAFVYVSVHRHLCIDTFFVSTCMF